MSNFPSYKTKTFSASQKFFVLDPNTGSPAFVQGSDLVAQITPNSNYVFAERTRTTAQSTDYEIGALVQTAGDTAVADNGAAYFLVVAAGEGDFPMDNGNELLFLYDDDLLREQLALNTTGNGSDLIAHTGTSDTVTEALDKLNTAVDKRTIFVGSVAEDIAAVSPADNAVYIVNGWQVDSKKGGGVFVYDSSRAKSDHDGIVVVSGTVPAVSAQAGADAQEKSKSFRDASGETDPSGNGVFVRTYQTVDPYCAGVVDGTDSGEALQDFFDFLGSDNLNYSYDITCAINASRRFSITSSGQNKEVSGICDITFASSVVNESDPGALTLNNVRRWHFTGGFDIDGYNGVSGPHRMLDVVVCNGTRGTVIEELYCRGAEAFSVRVLGPTNDNTLTIRKISALNCGYAKETKERAYAFVSSSGGETSLGHRSIVSIDLDEFTDYALADCLLYFEGNLQVVESYNRTTNEATLFPGFVSTYTHGATSQVIVGGGVHTIGGDSGEFSCDLLDCNGSGIGTWSKALYGSVIKRLLAQDCGVGACVGIHPDSGLSQGSVLIHTYFESNSVDLVSVSIGAGLSVVSPITALGSEDFRALKAPADIQNKSDRFNIFGFQGVTPASGVWFSEAEKGIVIGNSGRTIDSPRKLALDGANANTTRVFTLTVNALDSGRDYRTREFALYRCPGTAVFQGANGDNVNGAASLSYDNLPTGTVCRAYYNTVEWFVEFILPSDMSSYVTP